MKKLPTPHKKVLLPSREAVNKLTKGGAQAMSMSNYAKLTPSGANAPIGYRDIFEMGQAGSVGQTQMSEPLYGIVMAAADLKLAAPREYDKLVEAVKLFEDRCRDDLAAADANVIFPAQGKVQLVSQLRQKLETCLDLRAKYEARK